MNYNCIKNCTSVISKQHVIDFTFHHNLEGKHRVIVRNAWNTTRKTNAKQNA